MLIDLHNHTSRLSFDSFLTPEELVHEAKARGLDAICITEHDYFWDHQELYDISKRMNFLVFPGVEINTDEGHLLVFGLTDYVFGMHRTSFVKKRVDRVGGAIIAAHPYRRKFRPEYKDQQEYETMVERASRNSLLSVADGVEVLNGRGSEEQNAFARAVGRRVGLRGVGTSDAHQLHDIARYATRFEKKIQTLEDLIRELKAGRFRPEVVEGHCSQTPALHFH